MKEKDFLIRTKPLAGSGTQDMYGGTLSKSVRRFDDNTKNFDARFNKLGYVKKTMQDSELFGDLFEALTSKKSSYITYLNESFDCPSEQIVLPHYVYCLVKNIRSCNIPSTIRGEILTPQMANLMHIPTTYNVLLEKDDAHECDEITKYSKIASVDFTPYGYRFEDLSSLGSAFHEGDTIEECVKEFNRTISRMQNAGEIKLSIKERNALQSGFIDQVLFRNMLCEDADFASKNMGLLIGNNGECTMAPMFDFEYYFCGKRPLCVFETFAYSGFEYLYQNHHREVESFMKRLAICQSNGSFEKIIKGGDYMSDYNKQRTLSMISSNVKVMQEKWEEVKQKHSDIDNCMS